MTTSVVAATNAAVMEQFGVATQLWCPSTGTFATASAVLSNKVVILYFSAQWCGPCRKFTPILKTIYEKLKRKQQQQQHLQQQATPTSAQNDDFIDDFEIVYCSSDNYTTEYNSYATQMPWWCLPHQSPLVDKLRAVYQAEGIPHLCVIDKNGELICGDAVSEVMEDTNGTNFPWRCPHSLEEILPDTYVDKEGNYHPTSDLHNKYLLLYFGAQWCQRSTVFTEQLKQAYTTLKQTRNDFEILFVSSDRDRRSFKEFFSQMPFGAIPFGDRTARNKMTKFLHIQGIPALLMFGPRPDGGIRPLINRNVRAIFERGDFIKDFPYLPPPACGDINQITEDIKSHRFLVVFHEAGDDHEQDEIKKVIRSAAEKCHDVKPITMCWALCASGLCESLRSVLGLGLPQDNPTMVLLDIPDGGSYYLCHASSDITPDCIVSFIKAPGTPLKIQ